MHIRLRFSLLPGVNTGVNATVNKRVNKAVNEAVNEAEKCRKTREKATFRPFDHFPAIW